MENRTHAQPRSAQESAQSSIPEANRAFEDALSQTYQRFLVVTDKKQEVFDEDLMAILHDEIRAEPAVPKVNKAICIVARIAAKLARYDTRAVTSGTEALGEVAVHLEAGGRNVTGRGASTGVIEGNAKAYVDGLNKLVGFGVS
jgi:2-isopropylmalate synthase